MGVPVISFDGPPDHVNSRGVMWWLQQGGTELAYLHGLYNVTVWNVRDQDNRRTRIVMRDDTILFAHPSIHQVAEFIRSLSAGHAS